MNFQSRFAFSILLLATASIFVHPASANPLDACTDEYAEPIAYFSLDHQDVSSTTASDRSGNHDAVIYGNPKTVMGMTGTALQFNGVSDYLEADHFPEIIKQLTISAWVKLLADPAGQALSIVDKTSQSSGATFQLHASNHFAANVKTTSSYLTAPDGKSSSNYVGTWVHLAMTYKGGVVTLYRDGKIVSEKTGSNVPLESALVSTLMAAGRDSAGQPLPLAVELDEVAFWDADVAQSGVNTLYLRGKSGLELWDDSGCLPAISDSYSYVKILPGAGVFANNQDEIDVDVYVNDENMAAMPNVTVSVTASNGASVVGTVPVTDSYGFTRARIRSSTPGVSTITVTADPNGQAQPLTNIINTAIFIDPGRTYWGEFYDLAPLTAPNVVGVFADQTDLGLMLNVPAKPEFDQYELLMNDFGTFSFLGGVVDVAPPGGIIATSPLLYFGGGTDAVGQSLLVASGSHSLWAPEFGSFLIPEGEPYIRSFVGGAFPSNALSCACGFQEGCAPGGDLVGPNPGCDNPYAPGTLDCVGSLDVTVGQVASRAGEDLSCSRLCPTECTEQDYGSELPESPIADSCFELNLDFDPPLVNEHACEVLAGIEHCACRGQANCMYTSASDAFDSAVAPAGQCDLATCDLNGGSSSSSTCCATAFSSYDAIIQNTPEDVDTAGELISFSPPEQHMLCLRDSSLGGGSICSDLSGTPENCRTDICGLMVQPQGIYCQDAAGADALFAAGNQDAQAGAGCVICGGTAGIGCMPLGPPTSWELDDTGGQTDDGKESESPDVDSNGKSAADSKKETDPNKEDNAADPIALGSGEFFFGVTDASFPARGIPFELTRNYRSGGSQSGVMGPGFSHSYEDYVEIVGDRFNRLDAPQYCVDKLPTIRCLYHYTGTGARTLHVFDSATGVYSATNGGFSTIRRVVDGFLMREPGGNESFYNELGRLESMKDHQGYGVELTWRVRSVDEVRDEGSSTSYVGTLFDQAVEKFGMYYERVHDLAIHDPMGVSERNLMFARLELDSVTDSFGRVFSFDYETWEDGAVVDPVAQPGNGTLQRRRRLKSVSFRGAPLVTYDYTWFASTTEAYLTKVIRTGVTSAALSAAERVIRYEYQWDFIVNNLDTIGVDQFGVATAPTAWSASVADSLQYASASGNHCGRNIIPAVPTADNNDGCSEISFRGTETYANKAPLSLRDPIRSAIADNIVRVYLGDVGEVPDNRPNVETYYDPDPRSIDFDRAVIQRYGATPSAVQLAPDVVDTDTGTQMHVWKSVFPEARLYQAMTGVPEAVTPTIDTYGQKLRDDFPLTQAGEFPIIAGEPISKAQQDNPDFSGAFFEGSRSVPDAVLAVAAIEETVPYQAPAENNCRHLDSLVEYPSLFIREPAPTRADVFNTYGNVADSLPIVRSRSTCAAIAARQADDALRNESVRYFNDETVDPATGPKNGQRRAYLEADLARVCRWVEIERRDGEKEYHGLNFMGLDLIFAEPTPSTSTTNPSDWLVTLTHYNADGLVTKTGQYREAMGVPGAQGVTPQLILLGPETTSIYGQDNAVGFDWSPGARVLFRASPSRVEVTGVDPSTSPETPVAQGLIGNTPINVTSQVTEFSYDPVYQQLLAVREPGMTEPSVHLIYDYQQAFKPSISDLYDAAQFRPNHRGVIAARNAGVPAQLLAGQHCAPVGGIPVFTPGIGYPMYCGTDLDGDGTETVSASGALIASIQRNVDLDGTAASDVGTRFLLDDTGRVVEKRSLRQLEDPSLDENVVAYTYYNTLADAESGTLTGGFERIGPLGRVRAAKGQTPNDPDDAWTDIAYDATGGVRSSTNFDDSATLRSTIRDSLGRVVEETDTLGYSQTTQYDIEGNAIRTTLRDTSDSAFVPLERVAAIGSQRFPLGGCTPLKAGACDGFQSFAESVADMLRQGGASLPTLPDASYVVTGYDAEDRAIASVDAEGGRSTAIRNASGVVVRSEVETGTTPPLAVDYELDELGRATSVVTGGEIREHFQYDTLGRNVATQSRTTAATFTPNTATIDFLQFDLRGRPVQSWTEANTGSGGRSVLNATRIDLNAAGATRFTHQLARDIASTSSGFPGATPTSIASNDDWATTETRYDASLRTVWSKVEGVSTPSTFTYDGLGLTSRQNGDAIEQFERHPSIREYISVVTRLPAAPGTLSSRTTTTLDAAGRTQSISREDLSLSGRPTLTTSYLYDGIGRLQQVEDPSGRAGRRSFDAFGRMWRVEEIAPNHTVARTTTHDYDANGRVIATHAPSNQTTTFDYDLAGRLTEETVGAAFPLTSQIRTQSTFDAAGRLLSTSRSQQNGLSRIFGYTYPAGDAAPDTLSVDGQLAQSWIRDGLGRPIQAIDHNLVGASDDPNALASASVSATTNVVFDTLGRLTSDALLVNGADRGTVDVFWEDTFVGPTDIVTPSGETISYSYDNAGNASQVVRQSAGGQPVTANFEHVGGALTLTTVIDGQDKALTQAKHRNGFGWVTSSEFLTGTTLLTREDVLRGPTGKVTASRREGIRSGIKAKGFEYDHLGRLNLHSFSTGANAPDVATFVAGLASAMGNEAAGSGFAFTGSAPSHIANVSMNALDNLESVGVDEVGRQHVATFSSSIAGSPPETFGNAPVTLDAHFRVKSDASLDYVHDGLDRFRAAVAGLGTEIEAQYDAAGRRRVEFRRTSNTTTETVYLHYFGANVIEEVDASMQAVSATTFAPGVDTPTLFADGPTDAASSSVYALGSNVRGDVVAAVQLTTGTLVEEATVSPWGERTFFASNGTNCVEGGENSGTSEAKSQCAGAFDVLSRFGISGGRAHGRTKLVDLRARVYATHLKGFLARDPLGNIDSNGLWNYVVGDPLNLSDAFGLAAGEKYDSEEMAIAAAANEIIAQPQNVEHATAVYELDDGSFGYVEPVSGSELDVSIPELSASFWNFKTTVDGLKRVVADIHSHVTGTDDVSSTDFGEVHLERSERSGEKTTYSFLVTTDGKLFAFDSNGEMTEQGREVGTQLLVSKDIISALMKAIKDGGKPISLKEARALRDRITRELKKREAQEVEEKKQEDKKEKKEQAVERKEKKKEGE